MMQQNKNPVRFIDGKLVDELKAKAAASPRRRTNFNFHYSNADATHRFLNVMLKGSYLCPHRHSSPPKTETFLILEGQLALFVFDETGNITDCRLIGPGTPNLGIDIPSQSWHSMVVLTDHVICFEVKPGPYDPANPSEFAPWAPKENEPGSAEFLQKMTGEAIKRTGWSAA